MGAVSAGLIMAQNRVREKHNYVVLCRWGGNTTQIYLKACSLAIRSRLSLLRSLSAIVSAPSTRAPETSFASCSLLTIFFVPLGPARAVVPALSCFPCALLCLTEGRVVEPFDTYTAVQVARCLDLTTVPSLRSPLPPSSYT